MNKRKVLALCVGTALLGVALYDARVHFDRQVIQHKRKNQSPQKNWNIFYGQNYVYADSALRYQHDLSEIAKLIKPGYVTISDKATSYYLAASSNAYISNVQPHQGAYYSNGWLELISSKRICYMDETENSQRFKSYLVSEQNRSSPAPIRYVLINHDARNKNVRLDCLWNRRQSVEQAVAPIANMLYQSQNFSLFELSLSD